VIPPEFDYVRPASAADAVAALAERGEEAKVLAGGQSLLPLLRLRLAFPSALVDVGRIGELRGVREEGDAVVIGAATPHADVLADPLVARHLPLLAAATGTVADPAVRHRGTLGGALAHADPAGDLPAVARALDATFLAEGPGGRREVAAADFFVDYLQTALGPDELLVAVRWPKLAGGWGAHYEKFNRVAQQWAVVGVAAAVRREDGRVAAAAAEGTSPGSDGNASAEYRRHLAAVLTRRAVARAAGVPAGGEDHARR
jgi:carbon-monoxide dehydrogenase medium subunit